MWRILNNLFLGDATDAANRELLLHVGITHVLNCARECRCFYQTDFRYLHLKLRDPDGTFQDRIPEICRFIRRGRCRGAVLVHCIAGLSRSPSAITAYLCGRGKTIRQALRIIRRGVGEDSGSFFEPDPAFIEQIRDYFDLG